MKVVLLLLAGLLGSKTWVSGSPDPSVLPDSVQIQSFEFRPVFREGDAQKAWIPPDSTDLRAAEERARSTSPGPSPDVHTLENGPKQERVGFGVHLQLKIPAPEISQESTGISRLWILNPGRS